MKELWKKQDAIISSLVILKQENGIYYLWLILITSNLVSRLRMNIHTVQRFHSQVIRRDNRKGSIMLPFYLYSLFKAPIPSNSQPTTKATPPNGVIIPNLEIPIKAIVYKLNENKIM